MVDSPEEITQETIKLVANKTPFILCVAYRIKSRIAHGMTIV